MMNLKQVGVARPTSMPLRARRALQAARRRRGRSRRRGGRHDPARKRQRLEADAKAFMAAARKWEAQERTKGCPRDTRSVRAMQQIKDSLDRSMESCVLAKRGAVGVPDFLVPALKREAAEKAALRASRSLGVPPPEIRWFGHVKGSKRRSLGWFADLFPETIWLRADLRPSRVPWTVAHETAHYADSRSGGPATEERADRFAASFNRQYDWRSHYN